MLGWNEISQGSMYYMDCLTKKYRNQLADVTGSLAYWRSIFLLYVIGAAVLMHLTRNFTRCMFFTHVLELFLFILSVIDPLYFCTSPSAGLREKTRSHQTRRREKMCKPKAGKKGYGKPEVKAE